jgi:hypothetical protein
MSRIDIHKQKAKLDEQFRRVGQVKDPYLQPLFANHLCVLVSGFLEQSVRNLYESYAQGKSSPLVAEYVSNSLKANRSANLKAEALCQLAGMFSEKWQKELAVSWRTMAVRKL